MCMYIHTQTRLCSYPPDWSHKHTATHCNTLQHTATHSTTPVPISPNVSLRRRLIPMPIHPTLKKSDAGSSCGVTNAPRHTATHCNTLQHTCAHTPQIEDIRRRLIVQSHEHRHRGDHFNRDRARYILHN